VGLGHCGGIFLLVLATIGTLIAVGQWLVLRRQVPTRRTWIGLTVLGFTVSEVLYVLAWLYPFLPLHLGLIALGGALLGSFQCLTLRHHLPHARQWMLAQPAVYLLGAGTAAWVPFPTLPLAEELTDAQLAQLMGDYSGGVERFFVQLALTRGLVMAVASGLVMHRLVGAVAEVSPPPSTNQP
jgi:hypothetical protein